MLKSRGFTLVESLVVMAVIALIVMVTAAAYIRYDRKQKLVVEGNRLVQALTNIQKKAIQGDVSTCQEDESLIGYMIPMDSISSNAIQYTAKCSIALATTSQIDIGNGVTISGFSPPTGDVLMAWPNGEVDQNVLIDLVRNNNHACIELSGTTINISQGGCN